MTTDSEAADLEAKLRSALPTLAANAARALSFCALAGMAPAAVREATERQQAQIEGRTVTWSDVAAMVRRLGHPLVVMLDTHAPTHALLVMEPNEHQDRRVIVMHPDTARMCRRHAPLESMLLGIPGPDVPRG